MKQQITACTVNEITSNYGVVLKNYLTW